MEGTFRGLPHSWHGLLRPPVERSHEGQPQGHLAPPKPGRTRSPPSPGTGPPSPSARTCVLHQQQLLRVVGAEEEFVAALWPPARDEVAVEGGPTHHVLPAENGHHREAFIQHVHGELRGGRGG